MTELTESQMREEVDNLIKKYNLDAQIINIEEDYDRLTVFVDVARKDFLRSMDVPNYFDNYCIRFQQRIPKLVKAELGDLVLLFCQHSVNDEDSDVGIVSSKFVNETGECSYGCRYIKFGLNNRWVDSFYDFEITKEDYGGFHSGFLKILTQDEAIRHLKRQLSDAFDKALLDVQEKFKRSIKNVDTLIGSFSTLSKSKRESLDFPQDFGFYGVKVE